MPTALPAAAGPSDETPEFAHSPSNSEDRNPPLPVPERPWSPSVPAALSTLTLRRYNIAAHRTEQPENGNSSSEIQPSISTEVSAHTCPPTPPTPASPAKAKPPTKSNSFVPGGFGSGVTGLPPSSSFSDEDSKVSGLFTAQQYCLNPCQHRTGWSPTGEDCLCSILGTAVVTF